MKYIDKLLKALKTDRNTFFTYIFTLLSAYVVIDRLVEMIILFFTGMSVNYWGPITYTLAMSCPIIAFLLCYASKFVKSDENKISFFFTYCIALYIVGISMIVQWLNRISWIAILSAPNYSEIINSFPNLIKNAFAAISIYIPLTTFYKLLGWIFKSVKDPIFPNNFEDSILDYGGLDISGANSSTGPYSFENTLCIDKSTGKPVKILEERRFQPTLIVGPSGTGKTAMVMEPMIARDIEKKFFFREVSKEMGYTALKTGIAVLNKPYDNDYLNKNFTLAMLTPAEGKEKIYKAYMNKMIYATAPDGTIVYRNLGVTVVTPDADHVNRIKEVADNFGISYIEIDPTNSNSLGLNPFTIGNAPLCGLIISLVIRSLYSPATHTAELAYNEDMSQQAIQNLVMLLKVMYPRLNDGLMPNLEDLMKCFNNFDLVEEMCEKLKEDEELTKEYALQLGYFKQNFYKDAPGRKDMQRYVHFSSSLLDTLLRSGEVRNIICNRYNNINFTDVINNGKVVLISTRPYEIGGTGANGFGQFFLDLMMCSVEVSRGVEKSRIPHFLYIDEFNRYSSVGSDLITLYRKFNVSITLSTPNLTSVEDGINGKFMQTLLSNAGTKLSFGNCSPEEFEWWEKEFGQRREWAISNNYNKEDNNGVYSSNLGSVSWGWQNTMKQGKLQGLGFKKVIYKVKDKKGKNKVNFGNVDFLESKYKAPHKSKNYNFKKYISAVSPDDKEEKKKFNPKNVDFDSFNDNVDPIVTNTTDSSYFFNNEDAVSFNFGKKK